MRTRITNRERPGKIGESEVMTKMKPFVGSAVTRLGKPPAEHGVVTEVGTDTVIVSWHLKQDELPGRGRAGTPVGKVYEDPAMLMPDIRCPHCKLP